MRDLDLLAVTVNDVILRFPASVAVFGRHGIDSCCGGALPVREAALRHGLDPAELARELARIVEDGG